ncbi:MAG: hypothetical protein HN348_18495, partial [Proteobacteria bacterium]|nr:hypothetical protein [Pseudomonadota bacterium]
MANFYEDNEDLRFYIEKGIDWRPLVELTEYDFRSEDGFQNVEEAVEFYREVLDLIGNLAANEVAPRAKAIDRDHPTMKDGEVTDTPGMIEIMEQVTEMEVHGMCAPRELGGMSCPMVLFLVTTELMARADVSVGAHVGFHGGMAMAMLMYSLIEGTTEINKEEARLVSTRFQEYIEEIIAGKAWGSMDITEPGAGSDMAALRTKGEQDEDGNWFVTGQKVLITSGHGKYHFVIARTEKAKSEDAFAGLQGLSLFLVPAWEDKDGKRVRLTSLDGMEEKLGHHGSATVSISYDKTPAHLIGRRGDGFKQMLMLMNNARVGVGFECLGVCESAFRLASEFAAERPSMGKMIDRHEMIADYLDEMATDIQAIRALAFEGAIQEELAQKINLKIDYWDDSDEETRKALRKEQKRRKGKARLLTPLVKYLGAEKAVEHSRRCIQILGGGGYTTDYGAEKLLRDAMVMPIYEGTSQIQALMAMKDNLMGVVQRPQAFLKRSAATRWRAVSAKDPLERRVANIQHYRNATLRFLITRLATAKLGELRNHKFAQWSKVLTSFDPKRDFALAMLHAERLTRILCDVAVCEVLWEQSQKHPERRELLERYLERAEPRARYYLDMIH